MQWKLQQQAQQLQAELARATQQLQLHSIAFSAAAPAVTMAG
jgi:DNA-binding protein YbaB